MSVSDSKMVGGEMAKHTTLFWKSDFAVERTREIMCIVSCRVVRWRCSVCACLYVCRPLHCAVAGNHVTIVRELLRCGADVTKQNGAKRSVLQLSKGRAVRQLIHGNRTSPLPSP